MAVIFLKIVNMSITATWLALAIMLLRLVLKKIPKWIICVLWGFVAVRLLIPFSFESVWSLVPSTETIPVDFIFLEEPKIDSGFEIVDEVINPIVLESVKPNAQTGVSSAKNWIDIATYIWIAGIGVMLIYAGVSFYLIKRKLREAVKIDQDSKLRIWICDHVSSAFILGVFYPRIYLSSDLAEEDMEYVIAHERAHLQRLDHIWKPFGFALLSIYWFNPILWIAYILLCRDIEFACDEKVIKQLDVQVKKRYSETLLRCSVSRRMITICPLAFGDVSVKERVRSVLNYRKPKFWIIVMAVVICVGIALGLMTNPLKPEIQAEKPETQGDTFGNQGETPEIPSEKIAIQDKNVERFLRSAVVRHYTSEQTGENFIAADWEVLKVEEKNQQITVFLRVLCEEYSYNSAEDVLKVERRANTPTMITIDKNDNAYVLAEYWVPESTKVDESSIKDKFPSDLWDVVMDDQGAMEEQTKSCLAQAQAYYMPPHDDYMNLDVAKKNYPACFELNVIKDGLGIYVWQTSEGSYACGVLEGRNHAITTEEMLLLLEQSFSLEMMYVILTETYYKEWMELEVIPYSMTQSRYIEDVSEEDYKELCVYLGFERIEEIWKEKDEERIEFTENLKKQQELMQLEMQFAAEREELKKEQAEESMRIHQELETKKKALEAEMDAELSRVNEAYAEKLKELSRTMDEKMEQLDAETQAKIEESKRQEQDQIQSLDEE